MAGRLSGSEGPRILVLTGARQTGKTTLLKTQFPKLRYISLDAPENREVLRAVPSSRWGRDVGGAVLDEAQKLPVLFEKLKFAFDEGQVEFSVLCGSSQILLLRNIRETLAGRVTVLELYPLMMSELLHLRADFRGQTPLLDTVLTATCLDEVLDREPSVLFEKERTRLVEAEDHLLQWGGMPALLRLSPAARSAWLKDYVFTYLERDLADLTRTADLEPFKKFQRLAALRAGCLLNYSELARDAGISVDTVRRYLEYLRVSYQTLLLQPFHRNLTSSVVKTPKLYWIDTGLLRRMSGRMSGMFGELFENLVVAEIFKWLRTGGHETEMYFYRTRSGLEVDLLLSGESGLFGIEVKMGEGLHPRQVAPLQEIAAHLKREWRGGLVVYRGHEIRKVAEPSIWAVPSYRLFGDASG